MTDTPNLTDNWDEFRHEFDYPIITTSWEKDILVVELKIPARHWHKDWDGKQESLLKVFHCLSFRLDPMDMPMFAEPQEGPIRTPTKEWILEQVRNNPTMPPAQGKDFSENKDP